MALSFTSVLQYIHTGQFGKLRHKTNLHV